MRLKHSFLDLYIDFDKNTIVGKVVHELDRSSDSNLLCLDINNLKIFDVLLLNSGCQSNYWIEEKEGCGQLLMIPILPDTIRVSITYSTSKNADALLWISKEQTESGESPMLITQSQPVLANSWIPLIDQPDQKFTFQAKITSSIPATILMGAENRQQEDEFVGLFKMNKPISPYMLSLAVGQFEYKSIGNGIGVFGEKIKIEEVKAELNIVPDFMNQAQYLFGPYQWGTYDLLIMPPGFPWGGMENPCLSFISPTVFDGKGSLLSIIAHELAHSWSGNLVCMKSWDDFWLNEGMTVYLERRICESIYGEQIVNQMEFLAFEELNEFIAKSQTHEQILQRKLKDENPDVLMNPIPYEKGYHFFKYLESVLGKEFLDRFLNKYFDDFSFKNINTGGFVVYLFLFCAENKISVDQESIKEWIHNPGLPETMLKPSDNLFSKVHKAIEKINSLWNPIRIKIDKWTVYEQIYLITHLDESLPHVQIEKIDIAFKFSNHINKEIRFQWLLYCIKNQFLGIEKELESFLSEIGRKRMIYPLYEALVSFPKGKEIALNYLELFGEKYHSLSRKPIEALFQDIKT